MKFISFPRILASAFALLLLLAARGVAQPADSLLLENLGRNINSTYNDVGPVISPDGKTLYFDRTDHPDNIGNDDIWYSTLQSDGSWAPAKNIGTPLNNFDHNFVSTVTPDGNTLLLGNVYNPDGTMGPGVSIVHRTRDGWGKPQKLNIRNYYSRALSANYYLGNDGKTLLMAVDRNDTRGDLDLYVSFLRSNGEWSEPLNLGPDVNTRGADRTPFLAADGVTLYFASDGRGGYGSSDIFVTRRLDSTWQHWSAPENLGPPINSEAWDGFFTIPASGDYAYLVSAKNSFGEADIFRVLLPERMRPHPVVLLSGHVYDAATKKPLDATITYEGSGPGGRGGTARTDPATGAYRVTLPAGAKYSFTATSDGYRPDHTSVDLSKTATYQETTHDFYLKPGPRPVADEPIGPIEFVTGSTQVSSTAASTLERIATKLKADASVQAEVAGHTDNVGDESANQALSERRAEAVAAYLRKFGVPTDQITTRGYGESQPIESNDTEAGRRKNRRVVVTIVAR
ncbi:MAG TPA: OmpA family protein [Candidatus Kapabacteria bacterium]|nr:OmpA family protein [Candidatus Kapabacteria bacterium]